jgi:hypothetical protein
MCNHARQVIAYQVDRDVWQTTPLKLMDGLEIVLPCLEKLNGFLLLVHSSSTDDVQRIMRHSNGSFERETDASKQRRAAFGVFNSPHPFSHNDQQDLCILIATRLRNLL